MTAPSSLRHASSPGPLFAASLRSAADKLGMSLRRGIVALACAASLLAPASALAAQSVGSREQIAWVRRATGNFVTAELGGNGAGACAILNAPLRATEHHRSCAQRWDSKLAAILREPGGRARLKAQRQAIGIAAVIIHGNVASIDLPAPLLSGSNSLLWTENCWMVKG